MGTQDKIGENEGIDAEYSDDVSYVPTEKDVESPDEKSDAQRVAEGEIVLEPEKDEIFISPDSAYAPQEKKLEEKPASEEPIKETPKPPGKEKLLPEKDEKEKEKKPGKPAAAPDIVQKRINKITREKYEAIKKLEQIEKENIELKERLSISTIQEEESKLKDSKPKVDDFESEADFFEALGRWGAKMELHEAATKKTQEKPVEKPAVGEDSIKKILDLGEETYGDFMEVISGIPITNEMLAAAIDSEYAHEIFYDLGQHPEEAKRIAELKTTIAIARAIGKVEAQFIVPEVYEKKPGEDSEFLEKSKKSRPSTPPPVKPLGGGGGVVKNLEDMTLAEHYEHRGYTRDGVKKSRIA